MMKDVSYLGAGKSFGEKSIEENKPCSATIYVRSEEVLVLSLIRNDYKKMIGDTFQI
jgi:CRP-like cAMP-binding protein